MGTYMILHTALNTSCLWDEQLKPFVNIAGTLGAVVIDSEIWNSQE